MEDKMCGRLIFLWLYLMVIATAVSGQTQTQRDARTRLIESGNMLNPLPESQEDCQGTLNGITTWQEKQLREFGTSPITLHISVPPDGAHVPELPFVEGTVSDRQARVWVIVHPMQQADFWVQQKATVRENRTWRLQIHIGRPGSVDVGQHFEIMAIANPKIDLTEGDIKHDWPESQGKSQVIEVIRK